MSLHTLANHLQSAGRGDDKVLVHMTPKEVTGLQSLAMAHGGSLTINPETGLPEAGFLSRLLPTIIGAGLTIASGGALSPLMAAGITGAGYGIAKGSLKEGLMAGLGAYGGAGLASGLAQAGASSVGTGLGEFGANAGAGTGADYAAWMGTKGGELATQQALAGAGTNVGTNMGTSLVDAGTGAINAAPVSNLAQAPTLAQTQGDVLASIQKINPVPAATDVQLVAPTSGTELASKLANPTQATNYLAPTETAPSWLNAAPAQPPSYMDKVGAGFKDVTSSGSKAWEFAKENPAPFIGLGVNALQSYQEQQAEDAANAANASKGSPGMIRPYEYSVAQNQSAYAPNPSTAERQYFVQPRFIPKEPYAAKEGGLMNLAVGGPVEQMSAENAIGGNMMYPQAQIQSPMYANPMISRPMPTDVINTGIDTPTDRYSGEMKMADGGVSSGYNLGGYSDGGRLLRGPGDGVSDSIPASIGDRQPARLADGEFVVPARIVSELGNGSTEAGARKLYAMMDRVQKARKKSIGKNKVAVNSKAEKLLPA